MKIHAEMAKKSQVKDQLFLHRYHFFVELRVVALNHNCKIYIQILAININILIHVVLLIQNYILFCQLYKTFKRN